jgi:hypothetical protein
MLYVASNGMAKTAEESRMGIVAAGYAMKYTKVIRQSQQKLFCGYLRFSILYDLFWPTCLSSGNTHYV